MDNEEAWLDATKEAYDRNPSRAIESYPQFEVHLGKALPAPSGRAVRDCIIWINGVRWEGMLWSK